MLINYLSILTFNQLLSQARTNKNKNNKQFWVVNENVKLKKNCIIATTSISDLKSVLFLETHSHMNMAYDIWEVLQKKQKALYKAGNKWQIALS